LTSHNCFVNKIIQFIKAIYHRLGDTLSKLNQWTEAERFHQAALEVQPDHVATHVSYGTMLARNVGSDFQTLIELEFQNFLYKF